MFQLLGSLISYLRNHQDLWWFLSQSSVRPSDSISDRYSDSYSHLSSDTFILKLEDWKHGIIKKFECCVLMFWQSRNVIHYEQAGLWRATLKISWRISYEFHQNLSLKCGLKWLSRCSTLLFWYDLPLDVLFIRCFC